MVIVIIIFLLPAPSIIIPLSLKVIGGNINMRTISNLNPYTNYTFSVAAIDDAGVVSSQSSQLAKQTPEGGKRETFETE